MGGRLLKRWISLPLKDIQPIADRHDIVGYFVENPSFMSETAVLIQQIGDLERLISKVAVSRINPREVVQLKRALRAVEPLKNLCDKSGCEPLRILGEQMNPCKSIADKIDRELNNDPPLQIIRGKVIADGVSRELDELRTILYSGKDYLNDLQAREIQRTGITLKISLIMFWLLYRSKKYSWTRFPGMDKNKRW
jgi:DNA mismatch repair protein MutS